MSLIRQTLIDTKYMRSLCSQWKMCFVYEAISRNIIYSVPKNDEKIFNSLNDHLSYRKMFFKKLQDAYLRDEQDEKSSPSAPFFHACPTVRPGFIATSIASSSY